MSYRVFWSPDAEKLLQALVEMAAEPDAFVESARKIDRQLATEPHEFGESRYDQVQIGFEQPLVVQFEVLEDVRTVIVFHVQQTGRLPG
jgi:hypothetical protein